MRRNFAFWRNAILIAAAHIALIVALIRWSKNATANEARNVVWLSGGDAAAAAGSGATLPPHTATPTPTPNDSATPQPALIAAKSEIQLPTATATPTASATPPQTPAATPRVTPKPTPKATPRPSRKPTPKPKHSAKPSPKPRPTAEESDTPDDEEEFSSPPPIVSATPASTPAPSGNGGTKRGGGGVVGGRASGNGSSDFGWYASMLHDRLYSEWNQPTGNVAAGAKLSALVHLRIEKDGRVSRFEVVRSSGNAAVDASIEAAGKRVTAVDALPDGLGTGDHYEVNIKFELSGDE